MYNIDMSVQGMGSLAGVFLFLTTISVALRFIARRMQKVPFGVDGWCMIPAWLFFVVLVSNAIYGMAHHLVAFPEPADDDLLLSMFRSFAGVYATADISSAVSLGFTRISALFFYRRIFVVRGQKMTVFSMLTISGIVIISLWVVLFILLLVFVCGTDVNKTFSPSEDSSSCMTLPLLEAFGIISFVLDAMVLVLPIPKIWTLHTTRGRKLGIIGVFLFAATGVAASFTRMVITIMSINRGPSVGHEDTFLANTQLYYYMVLEAGLVLVATNLPSLWYFFNNSKVSEHLAKSIRSLISLRPSQSDSRQWKHIQKNTSNNTESSNSGIETTKEYKVEYELRSSETYTERLAYQT